MADEQRREGVARPRGPAAPPWRPATAAACDGFSPDATRLAVAAGIHGLLASQPAPVEADRCCGGGGGGGGCCGAPGTRRAASVGLRLATEETVRARVTAVRVLATSHTCERARERCQLRAHAVGVKVRACTKRDARGTLRWRPQRTSNSAPAGGGSTARSWSPSADRAHAATRPRRLAPPPRHSSSRPWLGANSSVWLRGALRGRAAPTNFSQLIRTPIVLEPLESSHVYTTDYLCGARHSTIQKELREVLRRSAGDLGAGGG